MKKIEPSSFLIVFMYMRTFFCSLFFLLIFSKAHVFAQPGPQISYDDLIAPVNKGLIENPNNDSLRLERVKINLRCDFSYSFKENINLNKLDTFNLNGNENLISYTFSHSPLADIDFLAKRLKSGKNSIDLSYSLIQSLYGEYYADLNPRLSVWHFRNASTSKQSEFIYTSIFDAYKKLNEVDSALLYHDTLNMLFHNQSVSKPRIEFFHYDKIWLLQSNDLYFNDLVNYYNWLSEEHFKVYRNSIETHPDDYSTKTHFEDGLKFQYDLCSAYLEKDSIELARNILTHLNQFTPRNKQGVLLKIYPFNRYSFLLGELARKEGRINESISHYLQASDHMSFYKDTIWTASILNQNINNPEAHLLHGQVKLNKSRQGYWHETKITPEIMQHFETAFELGSRNYKIFLARSFNYLINKEFQLALKQLDLAIKEYPYMPSLFGEKYQCYRKMYWQNLITNEELISLTDAAANEAEKLRVQAPTPLPYLLSNNQ